MDAATGCPTGDRLFTAYEELFTTYFDMVKMLVQKAGIQPVEVEDVAMEIIAKFIEKNGLENYDPHRTFSRADLHGANRGWSGYSKPKTAKFKGMLQGFTRVYVMSHRDKQKAKAYREPLRLEKIMPDGNEWGANIVDSSDIYDDCEVRVSVQNAVARARFELMVREEEQGQGDRLTSVFDVMIQENYMGGRLTQKAVAERLDMSAAAVGVIFREIKTVLRDAMDYDGVVLA